jgi:hypothetical protein
MIVRIFGTTLLLKTLKKQGGKSCYSRNTRINACFSSILPSANNSIVILTIAAAVVSHFEFVASKILPS